MKAFGYVGWIAFILLLGVLIVAVATGVLQYCPTGMYSADGTRPANVDNSEAPLTGSIIEVSSCLEVINLDRKTSRQMVEGIDLWEIPWKADIQNKCAYEIQALVTFSVYDKDEFLIQSSPEIVIVPPNKLYTIRAKMEALEKRNVRRIASHGIMIQVTNW